MQSTNKDIGPACFRIFQYGIHPLTNVPVLGYLVDMADGRKVLIDTGFPAKSAIRTRNLHRFRVDFQDHVVDRLASVFLDPADISFVICSHFDPDHCGGNDLFPHSELFVQRQQFEVARSGKHWRFELHRANWDHPGLKYTLVDGDSEILPGIHLIETSGHVPGHQSVLLCMQSSRKVLLTIDAVPKQEDFSSWGKVHAFDMDAEQTLKSRRKLNDVVEQGVNQVIYGHDAHQWPELIKAPGSYY